MRVGVRVGLAMLGTALIHAPLLLTSRPTPPVALTDVSPIDVMPITGSSRAAPSIKPPPRARVARRTTVPVVVAQSAVAVPSQAAVEAGPPAAGVAGAVANGEGGGGAARGAGSGGGPGPDLSALVAMLQARARACYPERARRFRVIGHGEISFCLDPDGSPRDVTLIATTGSPLLDEAALNCLLPRSEPTPIRGGCFRLPIHFGEP